jgi:hypothetical protein
MEKKAKNRLISLLIAVSLSSLSLNFYLMNNFNNSNSENIEISDNDRWILKTAKKYSIHNFLVFQRRNKLDSIAVRSIVNNDLGQFQDLYRRYSEVGRLPDFLIFSILMALENESPTAYLNTYNILNHRRIRSLNSKTLNSFAMYFLSKYSEFDESYRKDSLMIFADDTAFSRNDILDAKFYLKSLE